MNGNRGAKGSVKDRIISMLYRMRYNKKKIKEEEYTINKKNKQKKYLDNLVDFKEKEDIEILDNKDKSNLDKIKLTGTIKLNKKGIDNNLTNIESKKGNIELTNIESKIDDIELTNIELKTSELDNKVELKKEIKKTNNEIVILKEVDTFIKRSVNKIDELINEVETLKEESKDKTKDTKEIEEKYNKIKEKISKLKMQFDTIKEKYDLSEFSILESIKLSKNVDEYKSIATLNEIDMMLKVCKTEFDKIENIKIVYEEQKQVGSNIQENKNIQNKVKIKFIKSEDDLEHLKLIEEDLYNELRKQKEIIDDMYHKASFFKKEINKRIEYVGETKILSSLFKIATGIITLPFTGRSLFGKALGSTLINKGLKQLNKRLETRERLEISYKYEDITNQINEVKDKVEYINIVLVDSLSEIKKLKENFNNTYKKYIDILPDYQYTLDKIDNLENKLLEEQNKISKMNNKLEEEKEMNKQKLKKIKGV